MIDCIILAGGDKKNELVSQEDVSNKALLKIKEKEMVCYVLEALRGVNEIKRIVVVGPLEKIAFLEHKFSVEIIPETQSMWDNILKANFFLKSECHVLISSADIPLITSEAVKDFLAKCRPYDCDFYYPIISQETSEKRFPGVKRTYMAFREGVFTGGNIFLVNPAKIESSISIVDDFLKARKKPAKMLSYLGAGFVVRYLTKTLTISQLEERFSRMLKLKARAVESDYPEIGFDVDKPLDLELTRNILVNGYMP